MRKSGDPFEVDPLPKAFYYPTMQKELSEDERKICLSPDHRKEDQIKSPADKKFLRETNRMRIHEVPTRENGTTDPDHSSSSKFDESWPSTERAMVSTPEADIDGTEISKTPSSDGGDFPLRALPNSTLARYIHRFRNAPPSSRHERDHKYFGSGKEGEFWWLSPSPPSSSTPKEGSTPPNRQLPSPRPSLSPRVKRSTFRRGASPVSPVLKTRSTSSPSKSSLDGLDTKTAELQQRAKMLLEKSESTLDTSSSELYRPVRREKQGTPENRASRESPPQHPSTMPPTRREFMDQTVQHQLRPAPHPVDDILYQWRLARKMERAQEQAVKWGPAKGTPSLGSSQPRSAPNLPGAAGTIQRSSAQFPSSQVGVLHQKQELQVSAPVIPVVPPGTAGLSATTQTTFSTPLTVTSDQERISSPMIPSQYGITSQSQAPVLSGQFSQSAGETSQRSHDHVFTPSLEPTAVVLTSQPVISGQVCALVSEQDHFEKADVPSHMHLSCDILPCPHQRGLVDRARTDQTVTIPLSSPVVETMLENLNVAQRDTERDQKLQRTNVKESHDKVRIQGISRSRNGIEDQQARSNGESEDFERVEQRKTEIPARKQKSKPKRVSPKEPGATDVLSGVIGEVISERLFSTPQSSSSSFSGSDEGQRSQRPQEQAAVEDISPPDRNSDNEFPDDEILQMLQQRARHYREQLQQIDSILNQYTTGHPSS